MTESSDQQSQQQSSGEFERQPVPQSALLGFKSFIGMYAGEHCAGTELMIGPLFVAAGVSAFDVVFGLILGNALAVLSWIFLCAPIATRTRLTLYYQLEKICGRKLVTLYNLANGIMFCFLAGAMITVSATAVGVWFNFPMPGLADKLPNSFGWVMSVAVVGGLITVVAAYGYKTVAKFANIAAPWMVLVFLVFGIIGLKKFVDATDTNIESLGDFWTLAKTEIWKGGDPQQGQIKFTFWHVTFFAWFCNMAMHIGMSDLTVFRYAKKSWYGIAAGAGMYVGHFMAWLSASILYAYQLHLDPNNTDVLPGPMAFKAAGIAGLLCVIIAGWTTANPTIYRAGLAFQAIVPKKSRFAVTLFTGAVATVAGMFPYFAMKLLGFVAMYGLLLMPMGAIIFLDFWYFKKLGLTPNFAEVAKKSFNVAAAISWLTTVVVCLYVVQKGYLQIFFVSLPGWFLTAFLYIFISKFYQGQIQIEYTQRLRFVIQTIGRIALVALTLLGILYFAGSISLAQAKVSMIITTLVWFACAGYNAYNEKQV